MRGRDGLHVDVHALESRGGESRCEEPSSASSGRRWTRRDFQYCANFCEENTCLLLETLAKSAPGVPDRLLYAVFVSNALKAVPLYNQRTGMADEEDAGEEQEAEVSPRRRLILEGGGEEGGHPAAAQSPRGLVMWDYHVVGVQVVPGEPGGRCLVWDLETRNAVGLPTPVSSYLSATFRWGEHGWKIRDKYAPRFRVVPLETMRRNFRSDRSHMIVQPTGEWASPPPPWDPLYGADSDSDSGTNLMSHFVDMDAPHGGHGVVLNSIPDLLVHLDALARPPA